MQIIEGLDEPHLAGLVNHFYAQVRADPLLGPLFNQGIADCSLIKWMGFSSPGIADSLF